MYCPAIENAGAIARHVGETRLEAVHRFLALAKLLEGDVDLFELDSQIGFALIDRELTIGGTSLFHLPRMIRQSSRLAIAVSRRYCSKIVDDRLDCPHGSWTMASTLLSALMSTPRTADYDAQARSSSDHSIRMSRA